MTVVTVIQVSFVLKFWSSNYFPHWNELNCQWILIHSTTGLPVLKNSHYCITCFWSDSHHKKRHKILTPFNPIIPHQGSYELNFRSLVNDFLYFDRQVELLFFVTCLPFGSLLAPQASSKRVQGQMTPNNQTQHGPYCTFVQRHDSSNNWTLWGEKYCPRARLLATPQLQIAHSQSVYAPTVDNRHCHSIWGLYM